MVGVMAGLPVSSANTRPAGDAVGGIVGQPLVFGLSPYSLPFRNDLAERSDEPRRHTKTMKPICTTCGTQFDERDAPPERCPMCEDERQFVGWEGQRWTTLEQLRLGHRIAIRDQGDGLLGIGTEPKFAIGQRALLVPARAGDHPGRNILFDCTSLIDDAASKLVEAMGGLSAIAISHPHYYSSMIEWSRAFGGVPIYLHAHEREWVM